MSEDRRGNDEGDDFPEGSGDEEDEFEASVANVTNKVGTDTCDQEALEEIWETLGKTSGEVEMMPGEGGPSNSDVVEMYPPAHDNRSQENRFETRIIIEFDHPW